MRSALRSLWHRARGVVATQLGRGAAAQRASRVASYYDGLNASYLESYGQVIQAARPQDDQAFIALLAERMQLQGVGSALDAGCGVAGSAIGLCQHFEGKIRGVTVSPVQCAEARRRIAAAGLESRIEASVGDFQHLESLFGAESFDLVYFLESFGHASDVDAVLRGCRHVLRPGGAVYLKEFGPYPHVDADALRRQQVLIDDIDRQYHYAVLDVPAVLAAAHRAGLRVESLRRFDFVEDYSRALAFETSTEADVYTRALHSDRQMFEPIEIRLTRPPG